MSKAGKAEGEKKSARKGAALARRGERSVAKLDGGQPWRGDEHELRLAAAREAGLETEETRELELELYTEGFKSGMVLDDPDDRALVFRGRTVLREKQLAKSLRPTLRFLSVPADQIAVRVHDGEFEVRVARQAADQAKPALDSAKIVLKLWIGAGLLGLLAYSLLELAWLAAILWGVGLVVGGWTLRQGMISGRALLAARMITSLAMLAQEEQLILPPSKPKPAREGG